MKNDLEEMLKLIEENLIFDDQKYPELRGATEKQRFVFAVRHCSLHFAKRAGKITAVAEDADHGNDINLGELRENVPKAIVDALRLAQLIDMSWDDISTRIRNLYRNDNSIAK